MISHTNAAVEELKEKVGKHCPRLFTYPNFIGTIQSFVDQYLAAPFFSIILKKKIYRIDNEAYFEALERNLKCHLPNFSQDTYKRVLHINKANQKLIHSYRLKQDASGNIFVASSISGGPLQVHKPRGNEARKLSRL